MAPSPGQLWAPGPHHRGPIIYFGEEGMQHLFPGPTRSQEPHHPGPCIIKSGGEHATSLPKPQGGPGDPMATILMKGRGACMAPPHAHFGPMDPIPRGLALCSWEPTPR